MNRPIIAVDIDEVLSPLHDVFLAHHNAKYGTDFTFPDPHGRYFLQDITGELPEVTLQKLKEFVSSEQFEGIKPLTGSVTAIKQLSKSYDLVIITSRQDFYEQLTYKWFEKYFPDTFKDIRFTGYQIGTGLKVPKSVISKELGATYIIDDNLDIAFEAAQAGMQVVLFGNYPWNKVTDLPNNIFRCKDWPAVVEYFNARS